MKTRLLSLAITVFIAGILLTSCGEKSKQEAKEVKDDVKELNKNLKEGAKNTAEEIKMVVREDWEKFKSASENTIQNTEKEIKSLRDRISKISKKEQLKLTEQLDELEQMNIVLKDKLAVRTKRFKENLIEFNEKTRESEKEFEREFNHDMKELGIALKDLFKDNVN